MANIVPLDLLPKNLRAMVGEKDNIVPLDFLPENLRATEKNNIVPSDLLPKRLGGVDKAIELVAVEPVVEPVAVEPVAVEPVTAVAPVATNVTFDQSVGTIFTLEGGYVEDDAGAGPTNFGINGRANNLSKEEVQNLTKEDAKNIYKTKYWDAIGADNLPADIRMLAFDAAVNQGQSATKTMLEEAKNEDGTYDTQKFIALRKQRYDNTLSSGRFAKMSEKDRDAYKTSWDNRINDIASNNFGSAEEVQFAPEREEVQFIESGATPTTANPTVTGTDAFTIDKLTDRDKLAVKKFLTNQVNDLGELMHPDVDKSYAHLIQNWNTIPLENREAFVLSVRGEEEDSTDMRYSDFAGYEPQEQTAKEQTTEEPIYGGLFGTLEAPGEVKEGSAGDLLIRGSKTGIDVTKNLPLALNLFTKVTNIGREGNILSIYDRIDNGETLDDIFPKDRFNQSISPEESRARSYLRSSSEERLELRNTEVKSIAYDQQAIEELYPKFVEFQQKLQAQGENVPEFSDIKSLGDFNKWLAFNGSAATMQLLPIMLTALITGGTGAFAISAAYGLQEGVGARYNHLKSLLKDLPPEDQAKALTKYIQETKDVTMATAIISGALDLFGGPVRRMLKNQSQKKVLEETLKEVGKETTAKTIKRKGREVAEDLIGEFVTGGLQSAAQIKAELVLEEKKGPFFTAENMKRMLNDAAAEAAGVPGAKAIQATGVAGVNVVKKEIENRKIQSFLNDPKVPLLVKQFMESRMADGVSFAQAFEEVQEHFYGVDTPEQDVAVTGQDLVNAFDITDKEAVEYMLATSELLDRHDEYDAQKIADRAEQLVGEGKKTKTAFKQAEKEFVADNLEQSQIEEESDLQLEVLTDYEITEANAIVYRATKLIEGGATTTEAYEQAKEEFNSGADFFGPTPQQQDVDLTDADTAEIAQETAVGETIETLMNIDVAADPTVQLSNIQKELDLASTKESRLAAYKKLEILKQYNPGLSEYIYDTLRDVPAAERNQAQNMAAAEIKRGEKQQSKKLSIPDPSDRAPNLLTESIVARLNSALSTGTTSRIQLQTENSRLDSLIGIARNFSNNPNGQKLRLKLLTHLALISRSPELKGTQIQLDARDALRSYEYGVGQLQPSGGEDNRLRVKDKQKLPAKAKEIEAAKARAKKLNVYTKKDIAPDLGDTVGTFQEIKDRAEQTILNNIVPGPSPSPSPQENNSKNKEAVGPPRNPKVTRKPKTPLPRLVGEYERSLPILPSGFVGPPSSGSLRNLQNLLSLTDADADAKNLLSLTDADAEAMDADAIKINKILSDIDLNAGELGDLARAMGDYFKRSKNRNWNMATLLNNIEDISTDKFLYLLQALQTSDLGRVFKRLSKGILGPDDPDHFSAVKQFVTSMHGASNRILKDAKPLLDAWKEFNSKFSRASIALADLINLTTIAGIDPSRSKSVDAALRKDTKLKKLRARIKNEETSDKQKIKLRKQIEVRKKLIRKVFKDWDALGKEANGEGHRIYKAARDKYQDYFNDYEVLLKKAVKEAGLSKTETAVQIAAIETQFSAARENMPVYFPLKRYGNYFVRVKNSGDADLDGFYMFESASEVREAKIELKQTLSDFGVAVDGVEITEGTGSSIEQEMRSTDSFLRNILGVIDGKRGDTVSKDAVKNQIVQMYLAALPGQSIKTMFLKRKGTKGATQDVLRTFASVTSTVATQLPRLEYGDAIRREVSAARDQIKEFPNVFKLSSIIDELATRIGMELNPAQPTVLDKLATLGNKATFMWLMSAAKSGLLQTIQFPTIVAPTLMQDYGRELGYGTVASKIKTYLNVLNKIPLANSIKTWTKPTISKSLYFKNNKDKKLLLRAWNDAEELGKFNTTYAADIGDLASAPLAMGKFKKVSHFTYNFMTGFFHHAERVTREITFMSAFELAHQAALKKGLKKDAAYQYALKRASNNVDEGLFDYSQFNKPYVLRANAATKSAFQFMSFTAMLTSLMVRNFTEMVKPMNPEDRAGAAMVFWGVQIQTMMYAGVTNFFGASVIWTVYELAFGIYAAAIRLLEDKENEEETEEEKEEREGKQYTMGNPAYFQSLREYINYVEIPNKFGVHGTVTTYLGLGNTRYAKYLQTILEKGLISTALTIDMSSSIGLNGLIFRDQPGDPTAGYFENMLNSAGEVGFFPVASVIADIGTGIADVLKGDYQKGLERGAPAMVKGAVRAYGRSQKGLKATYTNAEVMGPDEYTATEIFAMALLGGRNLEESRQVGGAYIVNNYISKVNKEKSSISKDVKDRYIAFSEDSTKSNKYRLHTALQKLNDWNKKYPFQQGMQDTFKIIELDTIAESTITEELKRSLTSQMLGVQTANEAAINISIFHHLRNYKGIIVDQELLDAANKNMSLVNAKFTEQEKANDAKKIERKLQSIDADR